MLLRAVLIDALHAALEDRIVAFNRVGRNQPFALTANVFFLAVVDRGVIRNSRPTSI
jgi:hypothetical protein